MGQAADFFVSYTSANRAWAEAKTLVHLLHLEQGEPAAMSPGPPAGLRGPERLRRRYQITQTS